MRIFLAITIDVEPDCSLSWHYSNPLAFSGVTVGISKILHPLFQQYGMQPTYLINNVVLENEESISVFKSLPGKFELGTHLHGDFIEPEKIHHDYSGKDGVMNQCFLKPEIEFGKLKNITNLFKKQLGYDPVSFRAGRFSAGANTISSLAKLGYKVDTSVTPYIIWNDASREHPVDFSNVPDQPYWTSENDFPRSSNDKRLLQVPVSITTMRKWRILKRVSWLRPYYSDENKMIKVSEKLIEQNSDKPVVVLNIMFHNVEVMPGLNPYTKSNSDVIRYLDSLKYFFEFCDQKNIQPATLSDIHSHFL